MTISQAIQHIRPGASWTLRGSTYQDLDWLDAVQPKPTEQEIADAMLLPDPVPAEVPMWALKEVCMLGGYTAEIEAAFVQLPQPQQSIARNRWENKDTLSRASAHIEAMRVLMGWSNDQVDEMFRAADLESKR
jgi:hypothetical protein